MYRYCDAPCPFHDRGERFRCHAHNASSAPRCVTTPHDWNAACEATRGRTVVFVGDSLSKQSFDTLLCHMWRSSRTHDVEGIIVRCGTW